MSLEEKKAKRLAAKNKLDAARKAADANKEDVKLAAAVQEASLEFNTAQDEYVAALEVADPLSQNIEERVSKARQEEKTKLYARQEQVEKEKKELEAKVAKMTEDKKAADAAAAKAAAKPADGDDTAALSEDRINKILEERIGKERMEMEKASAIAQLEANKELQELKKQLAQKEVEAYKASKIAAAGNTIVPEIVTGNTKEEIDESIIKAQQAFQRIAKQMGDTRASVENNLRGQVPQTPTNGGSRLNLTGNLTAEAISKMTPQEWAAHRKNLGFK